MKIRTGFVSNSSSSSYMVLLDRVFSLTADSKNIWAKGIDLGEGIDFFEVTPKMLPFLVAHQGENDQELEFYQVFWKSAPDCDSLDKKTLKEIVASMDNNSHCILENMEISHHSTDSLSVLRGNYFPDVVDKAEEIAILKKKLDHEKGKIESSKSTIKELESEIKELEEK